MRAGPKSLTAFETAWLGPPLADYLARYAPTWETKYQDTLARCTDNDPTDVLNGVIDGSMTIFINGVGKAEAMFNARTNSLPEHEAFELSGGITLLGLLGQIVFSHCPAVADAIDASGSADEICRDVVQCIETSVNARKGEMHPAYAKGALTVLSVFLSKLD